MQAHVDDKIIVYCQAGSRSAQACQILVAHGFTKVYNMIGGIIAWMQADYPIFTSYHHVSVDIVGERTIVQIKPWILYRSSCTSCQNTPCSISSTQANTTETMLEASENHTRQLIRGEINGTIVEYIVDKTLLWKYNSLGSEFNRTITFVSTIITSGGNDTHLFGLKDNVQHKDYNLTVSTVLYPLDSETYNSSITTVEYIPSRKKEIVTAERIDFNVSATLSQHYSLLDKAINKLGKNYERSEDSNLNVFAERYYTIANEVKLLSRLVETYIPEYNKNILNITATVTDNCDCDNCEILCPILVLIGLGVCWAVCIFWGAACGFCVKYTEALQELEGLCTSLCYLICYVWNAVAADAYWLSSITYTGGYGSYAVDNPNNLLGSYADDNYVHLHACNFNDCAQIFGQLNAEATGDIYIYGCSGLGGYYSDIYVYVSYDNQDWDFVNSLTITATSPYDIYIGYVSSPFRYIAICGYDGGCSVCLYLDAVSVVS